MKLRSLLFPFGTALAMVVLARTATAVDATPYTFTALPASIGGPGAADGSGLAARFSYPAALAVDAAGNCYVADANNHTIRKITPAALVTTLAGLAETSGSADGTGGAARFNVPAAITVDKVGNVYVADKSNHTIRKITPAGVVTTLAGSARQSGTADETGTAARFNGPSGVAADDRGNVFVADTYNHTIRKIAPGGRVTTLAGLARLSGRLDGAGSNARFYSPKQIALDGAGNLFVADYDNQTVRKVTPAGVVSTFAGLGGAAGIADGTGSAARFVTPLGIAVDQAGNVYVAEYLLHTIRRISPGGEVTHFAGTPGQLGFDDGTGTAARFKGPHGLAVSPTGNLLVADTYNHTIRQITPAGVVSTFAGCASRFRNPSAVAVDAVRNVYVADTDNHAIRKLTPAGLMSTLAGTPGSAGNANGLGAAARFSSPLGVAADRAGNLYVADTGNHTIRKVTPDGTVTTLAGSPGVSGSANGTGSAARFFGPNGIALDGAGNIYVADTTNHVIRRITPKGVVTTLAGSAANPGSTNGAGSLARFNFPAALAVDRATNVYVADTANHTIRQITPARVVTTLAGLADSGGSADGTGPEARFNGPLGVAVDALGNIFVADSASQIIRRVTPAGVVTTVAGLAGQLGAANGTGAAARFYTPRGLAVDGAGCLYLADCQNQLIRKGNPALPDAPTLDQATGFVGATLRLGVANLTTTPLRWTVLRRPAGSSAPLSSVTALNPSFTPDSPDLYQFNYRGTNALGQVAFGTVEFQAKPVTPALAITSHADWDRVTTASIFLQGTATDAGAGDEGIRSVMVGNWEANGDSASGSASCAWSRAVSLALGLNTIKVIATDGGQHATTNWLRIVRLDAVPPALAITSHTNGQVVATDTIVLAGTASDATRGDNGVSSVTVNGIPAVGGTATTTNKARWSRAVLLAPGTNQLLVVAADGLKNSATNKFMVRSTAPDVTRPTLRFTSPAPSQRITNGLPALVTGAAADNDRVDRVMVKLKNVAWQRATGSNAWQFPVPAPMPVGPNVLYAYAVDPAGNRSLTNTLWWTNVATAPLAVTTTGRGTIKPNYNGRPLEIGKLYSMTAQPDPGWLFAGWTGSKISAAPTLAFTMAAGRHYAAQFNSNYFPVLQGAYNGLFSPDDPGSVTASNAGYFSLTLTPTGAFTARLWVAGTNRAFAGAFSPNNQAACAVAGLSVQLGLDLLSEGVTGQVASASWTSPLVGVRAAAAQGLAGRYTKLVGGGPDPAANPIGAGPLSLTVATNGLLQCLGTLADGSAVSRTAWVSAAGFWPFFAPLYGGRGLALGWLGLDTNNPAEPVLWVKPQLTGKYYPGGFRLTSDSSLWRCPPPGQPLFNWPQGNGIFRAQGGNLTGVLTNPASVNGNIVFVDPGQLSGVTLTLAATNGLFSGSFQHPSTGKPVPFQGALDRPAASQFVEGRGWFAGTNQCGSIWFGPAP